MTRVRAAAPGSAAALARWTLPAWGLLWIGGTHPEAARAMQAERPAGCVVVSPAESDAARQAETLQLPVGGVAAGIDVSALASVWRYPPLFDVRYESDGQTLRVRMEEVREDARVPAAYPVALVLEAGALGATERFEATLRGPMETFALPFPYRPRFVAVYPEEGRRAESRVSQPAAGWIAQLRHASLPAARLEAARALRSFPPDPALILGLRNAFGEEADAQTRVAIAQSMARLASGGAADRALAAVYEDAAPEVRRAALASLDRTLSSPALAALALRAAQSDPDPLAQAEAVRALARMRAPDALQVTRSALITPSRNEVIRIAGLDALGELHAYAYGSEPASGEEAEPVADTDLERTAPEVISRETLGDALAEGLQLAAAPYPLRLRGAARRLFLRVRQNEPAATYGAPDYLRALHPCP